MDNTSTQLNQNLIELSTFLVGDALCGMDILTIQEINKLIDMTSVPQAPSYVLGILNLRGQIITSIDLGKKLGLGETDMSQDPRNIIVNSRGEHIGLMVKQISDVVQADKDKFEPPPSNMGGIQGEFFTGVYKMKNKLIGILDVEKVLKMDEKK
jgi:purine-binding chemotaxis protein CheW